MKKFFQAVFLTLLATAFVFSTFAQKQKSKDDYFKEIATLSNKKTTEDTEKAYQLSREFIAAYPKEKGKNIDQIKDFIKRFRENKFYVTLDAKNYAEAFAIGKEILSEQPDNTAVIMNLAYGGFDALARKQDKTYAEDSLNYGKKTLELLGNGSFPSNFAPFLNKDDAIAWMYFVIGTFSMDKDLKEAAINYYKSTLYESQIKKNSQPYYVIAFYYESVYEKMSAELKKKSDAKTITDAEFKTENEKVDKIVDQMMDAYARAYTLGKAEQNPNAETWKQRLSQVYQFRKKTTAGLDAYIIYINNTTLADPANF